MNPLDEFKPGYLVTPDGLSVHRVIDIDSGSNFGKFKCLYDESGLYEVGVTQSTVEDRFDLIGKELYPELFDLCASRGWLLQ